MAPKRDGPVRAQDQRPKEFHGIEVGTLYVITLTVQNTGNTGNTMF